jgi:hypothetical protein
MFRTASVAKFRPGANDFSRCTGSEHEVGAHSHARDHGVAQRHPRAFVDHVERIDPPPRTLDILT